MKHKLFTTPLSLLNTTILYDISYRLYKKSKNSLKLLMPTVPKLVIFKFALTVFLYSLLTPNYSPLTTNFSLLTSNYLLRPVFAATTAATQSGTITTKATIRGNTFTVSGFTSPFASVIVTANNQFLVSTTANAQGNFSAPITIPAATTTLCFDALDFKRLGQSQTCINTANTSLIGIFLPPTIGLLSTTVDAGQNATMYGYSLPRSTVILKSEGKIYTTTTDDTGYYAYTVESVPAGTFVFSALGEVLGAQSLPPTGGVELKSLSRLEKTAKTAQDITKSLSSATTSHLPLILSFVLVLIIAIIIFLYVRRRKKKKRIN